MLPVVVGLLHHGRGRSSQMSELFVSLSSHFRRNWSKERLPRVDTGTTAIKRIFQAAWVQDVNRAEKKDPQRSLSCRREMSLRRE
jgi:hypothetical protein